MRPEEARFTFVDISAMSADVTPSRHSSTTGASVPSMSMDHSPNTATPESIRQFASDKFFGDIHLPGNSVDLEMSMGQGMGDDDGVEFFTEMLGVNLNGN
jgi:hypothetical protein